MRTLALLLVLGGAGVLAAVSLARPSATALDATVGPGFAIKLTKDGAAVRNLPAGDYTITVHDLSEEHDFHLAGGGINKATGIETTGTEVWNVTLTDDAYVYFCDAHAATMLGKFTVGNAPAETTTTASQPQLTSTLSAKALGRTVVVTAKASRPATFDMFVLRAGKKIAHVQRTGRATTWKVKVAKPGVYVVRVIASVTGPVVQKTATVTVG